MAAPPKVSLITVTYNAAAVLEPTIQSILAQTFTDYEYLIIDGGSKDATPDIIRRYADRLSYWVSEPDGGLYDAMNKGLRAARGEYVWFMNAGDRLYEADTLRKVFVDAPAGADVYYGDALFYEADGREVGLRSRVTPHPLPERLTWKSLRYGMVVCHQSFVPRRRIVPPYDLSHPYSADVDWEIRCLQGAQKTVNVRAVLSRYLTGGFSKKHHQESLRDRYQVLRKHFGPVPNLLNHAWITLRGALFVLRRGKGY
ncbi:MAG: glycosyltransferase [Cytophagales bacterium]|nr:glycosyltransferase [Cytophagales bacterium]